MKKKEASLIFSALKRLAGTTTKKVIKKFTAPPEYGEIKTLKTIDGSFKEFEEELLNSDSKIGLILGARGKGKTALGLKLVENLATKTRKNFYCMGFSNEKMPSWIQDVEDIKYIKNNSIVIIDEGGMMLSSRNSMSKANKLLSNLIFIARHKNLTILFVAQNSANLEINIIRQCDFIVLKKASLLQQNLERKIIQRFYENCFDDFKIFKSIIGTAYIYSDEFIGFVNNPLPSFWKENISKSFRNS